jgi:hypothetical protein
MSCIMAKFYLGKQIKLTIVAALIIGLLSAMAPKGTVHADFIQLSGSAGYLENDIPPETNNLAYLWTEDSRYIDRVNTSVGMDLGSTSRLNRLEVWDSDGSNRVGEENISIYISTENIKKAIGGQYREIYTKVTGWKLTWKHVDGRLVTVIDFPGEGIVGRYIKIHTNFSDDNPTLLLTNPRNDLKVFGGTVPTPTHIVDVGSEINWEQLSLLVGLNNSDTSPEVGGANGGISYLGYNGDAATDYEYRSIGIDLQRITQLEKVELWDSDNTSRITGASDYAIYASESGYAYTLATDWSFQERVENGRTVHEFLFNHLKARYIKIHTLFGDAAFTFILNNLQTDVKAFAYNEKKYQPLVSFLPSINGYTLNDQKPATSSLDHFGESLRIKWDGGNASVGLDLGSRKAVNKIELWNSTEISRLDKSGYSLYTSDDNIVFTPLENWDFTTYESGRRQVHIFEFNAVEARYFKIANKTSNRRTWFTIDDLQLDIKAYYAQKFEKESTAGQLPAVIGYAKGDKTPYKGSLSNFGSTEEFHYDIALNSIGADLGSAQAFNKIRLFDTDDYSRLRKNDFALYVSDDNITYNKLKDWDYFKDGDTFLFYNFSTSGRYVKVHQVYNDPITVPGPYYTVTARGGSLQNMMRVFREPERMFTLSGGGQWQYTKPVEVKDTVTSSVYDNVAYLTKDSLKIRQLIKAGQVQPGLEDIRFADKSGNELSYYEDRNGFYVRIPKMGLSKTVFVDLFYGNPKAKSRSDGAGTFQVEYGTKTVELDNRQKPVLLADNRLMLAYATDGVIYVKFSEDSGQTWSGPTKIDHVGNDYVGGMVKRSNGDILLTILDIVSWDHKFPLDPNKSQTGIYVVKSTDNGAHWGTPVKVETGKHYSVAIANMVELANGDLLLPFEYAYTDDAAFRISVVYSSDGGVTWTRSASDIELTGSGGFEQGAGEPAVVQISNGDVKMYFRQQGPQLNHLGESTSTDNGRTWSPAKDSIIYAPNTKPSFAKDGDNVLLFWAGNNTLGGSTYQRTPLNLAYSPDDMHTWYGYRDVSGRTFASSPFGDPMLLEPDLALAADDSAYFVWYQRYLTTFSPTRNESWFGMRIDDFNRYLYHSHGAYDDFESTDIKGNYWWVYGGNVYASHNKRFSGTSALRLVDNNKDDLTEAMRSFPGAKSGVVKFKWYADDLQSGFAFSLREAFGIGVTDPSTAFQLIIKDDGSVKYVDAAKVERELPVSTQMKFNWWYDIELRFDTGANQCEVYIDGKYKGAIDAFKHQNIISYFNISSTDKNVKGTDVYLDEFIVKDTKSPLHKTETRDAEDGND